MKIENLIRIMAGTFILVSLYLNSLYPNGYWLFFTAFVGFNLLQSGFTKWCPAEKIMKAFKIGSD